MWDPAWSVSAWTVLAKASLVLQQTDFQASQEGDDVIAGTTFPQNNSMALHVALWRYAAKAIDCRS